MRAFFEEGLATELGGDVGGCRSIPECASAELDQFLAATGSTSLGTLGYLAGADMVHGMLLAEGAVAVLAFTAAIDTSVAPNDIRAAYTEHFNASLDLDFEDYKRGLLDAYTPASLGCDAPRAPRTEVGGVVLEASMECGLANVVNDFAAAEDGDRDRGWIEWSFVVEPEHAGVFALQGTLEQDTYLLISRCAPIAMIGRIKELGPWSAGAELNSEHSLAQPLFLGPGLHTVLWKGKLDVGATLDLVLAPPCRFEDQDCPGGEQCTIWNLCEPETEQPAALGETCDPSQEAPLTCAAGSRCMGGVCVAECDATLPCSEDEGCTRIRVCGPPCDLLTQDCETGYNCLPSEDPHAAQAGHGQCVPAGPAQLFDGCDIRYGMCGEGLSCETVSPVAGLPCHMDGSEGCCVPFCDPTLADPDCPDEVPICVPLLDGVVGVYKT